MRCHPPSVKRSGRSPSIETGKRVPLNGMRVFSIFTFRGLLLLVSLFLLLLLLILLLLLLALLLLLLSALIFKRRHVVRGVPAVTMLLGVYRRGIRL